MMLGYRASLDCIEAANDFSLPLPSCQFDDQNPICPRTSA